MATSCAVRSHDVGCVDAALYRSTGIQQQKASAFPAPLRCTLASPTSAPSCPSTHPHHPLLPTLKSSRTVTRKAAHPSWRYDRSSESGPSQKEEKTQVHTQLVHTQLTQPSRTDARLPTPHHQRFTRSETNPHTPHAHNPLYKSLLTPHVLLLTGCGGCCWPAGSGRSSGSCCRHCCPTGGPSADPPGSSCSCHGGRPTC